MANKAKIPGRLLSAFAAQHEVERVSFELDSPFSPRGDQPLAIENLHTGVLGGIKAQTLLGVTGSGKTFTVANVIAKHKRPVPLNTSTALLIALRRPSTLNPPHANRSKL